jgi:Fe-S-cluster containining protein
MTDDHRDDARDDLARLERQVERGSFYTHSLVSQIADRLNELEPFLYGLIDALVARGVVAQDDIIAAGAQTRDELAEHDEHMNPGLAIRVDDESTEPVPVDCERRMPICKAVCCKLSFALTVEEIEAGGLRWDLGQPYFIRHEADGHCSHRASTGSCTVYDRRPGVCKRYSCAGDERIWKDFDAMVLNTEWLDDNLGDDGPHLVSAMMHRPEDLLRKVKPRGER